MYTIVRDDNFFLHNFKVDLIHQPKVFWQMADTTATQLLHLLPHSDYFVMSCKQEQTSKLLTSDGEVRKIHHQIKVQTDISLSTFRYLCKPQM